MARALRFNFRLYLEGVPVPFNSGSIVCRRDTATTATFQLAPTVPITKLLHKTLVHCTFWDPLTKDWHLLFEGEYSGRTKSKTATSRSFGIQAEGITNYWFRAYLYMLAGNNIGAFTDRQAARGHGAYRFYWAEERVADLSSFLKDPLEQSFKNVLSRVPQINDFYADVERRLKIVDRIKVLDDPELKGLTQRQALFHNVVNKIISSQTSQAASVITFLKSLMDLMYYEYIELSSPSSMDSQFIFKPKTYFCPPPRCNILFPSRYQSLTENRDFSSEPTRILMRTNAVWNPGKTAVDKNTLSHFALYAPVEIQEELEKIENTVGGDSGSVKATQALRDIFKYLTEEEKVRGIIPDYIELTPPEWMMDKLPSEDAGRKGSSLLWLRNIATYKYFLRKFQHRMASCGHSFNPYLIQGLPAAALDEFGNIFGMLDAFSHSFSVAGGSTSIDLGYVMYPEDSTQPGADAIPQLPAWFSLQYANGSAYNTIIGSKPVASSAQDSVSKLTEIFEQLRNVRDPLDYALDINKRKIVTQDEYFAHVGAAGSGSAKDPEVLYSGGPFRAEHQAAVKEHISFLAKKAALTGF